MITMSLDRSGIRERLLHHFTLVIVLVEALDSVEIGSWAVGFLVMVVVV